MGDGGWEGEQLWGYRWVTLGQMTSTYLWFYFKNWEAKTWLVSNISDAQNPIYLNVIRKVMNPAGFSVSSPGVFLCACLEFQVWGTHWISSASFSKLYTKKKNLLELLAKNMQNMQKFVRALSFLMLLTGHYCQEMFSRKIVLESNRLRNHRIKECPWSIA